MSNLLIYGAHSFIIQGVVRSNEKSCVCNVFATPHSKNPIKASVPSYLNVNHTFLECTTSKDFSTPQDFGSEEFFDGY